MMGKRIITISREFGSGGRFIGMEVAQKLGVKYYDKEMIGQIAEQSGFSPKYIQENAALSPKKIYEAQRKIILDIAEREECVIIGRNADFILKDRGDVLNVFIHGNMPEKVKRICGLYNVTEQEAVKMTEDIDKRRMSNYRFYTDQKWGMASNYTLSLNSSVLGYEMCERIIMECAGR